MAARGNYDEGIMEYDTTLLHNITKFPTPSQTPGEIYSVGGTNSI